MPCKWLQSIDLFGAPVSLIYKGESTFTTRVGGFFSLLWIIIVLSGFIQETIYIFLGGGGVESSYTAERRYFTEDYDSKETLNSNYTIMGNLLFGEGMLEQNYEIE